MISKEAASINESDGKMIRIIEGAAFINLPEKRFGGVVESDGLYLLPIKVERFSNISLFRSVAIYFETLLLSS